MSLSKLELYVLDLDYGVFRDICQNLDVESKYRDVIAAADDTRFQLELVSDVILALDACVVILSLYLLFC
jgi:hypothetical protein